MMQSEPCTTAVKAPVAIGLQLVGLTSQGRYLGGERLHPIKGCNTQPQLHLLLPPYSGILEFVVLDSGLTS